MNNNSCLLNIKSKLKILTGSEKKVGNYVLEQVIRKARRVVFFAFLMI